MGTAGQSRWVAVSPSYRRVLVRPEVSVSFLRPSGLCEPTRGRREYRLSRSGSFSAPTMDGLRLIQDVYQETFPDRDFRFVVVDDADVSDLEEEGPWTWYAPWDFVEAVEHGDFALEEPPGDAYRNDGVPFNSTTTPTLRLTVAP